MLLVVSALTVAGLLLRRELRAGARPSSVVATKTVENWQPFSADGRLSGHASARLKLVEFSDYECLGCALMHVQVQQLIEEFAPNLAVVHRNLPFPSHPHAMSAALAAECAADQGRLESFRNLVFADQKSIGVTPWDEFAAKARVDSLPRFQRCMREKQFLGQVQADMAMAKALGIYVTPTYLVEDVLLMGPNKTALKEQIQKALARRPTEASLPTPSKAP